MADVLIEEHGHYGFDCSKAVWKSDKIHDIYHACKLSSVLCDVDFVIETEENVILVEYKNSNIPEALAHATPDNEYNPFKGDKLQKIASKFFDSLHYLRVEGKEKPIHFVFVLEYPKGDSASRRGLRNRLKGLLPFELQKQDCFTAGVKLIEAVAVVNIEEWNEDTMYGQFPIVQIM